MSDNGANVKLGLRLAELPGIPCAIHTLQLVVNKGLQSQRVIIDTLSRARKIARHFNHSTQACERLQVGIIKLYANALLHASFIFVML